VRFLGNRTSSGWSQSHPGTLALPSRQYRGPSKASHVIGPRVVALPSRHAKTTSCRSRSQENFSCNRPSPRGQTALRSDRPSGPRTGAPAAPVPTGPPPRVASGLPGGQGEQPPLASVKKKTESPPLKQSLQQQGLECLRGPPGTGYLMTWCLLRTVGVALLYLSAEGKAWRCNSAVLTEILPFKAPECCTFSCSSKWCNRCAKHAFYRSHRAFGTSFEVPKPHYLLF
jgi:hypothetical protein